jgi:putative membrane protein insertion efficiency factor
LRIAPYFLTVPIRIYRRVLSPVLTAVIGPACRFSPTCSEYALQAIDQHGAVRGGWLATRRICRCHPWGDCGHDPVPPRAPGTLKREENLAGQADRPVAQLNLGHAAD